jgi:hypothetical protein
MKKVQHTLVAAALLIAFGAAQAQTVTAVSSLSQASLGDTFSVDLQATGFPDKIFGGGYNIAFDPTVLKLDSITFPGNWEFATSVGILDAAAGTVGDVFFNTFVAPIKGDFLTATLKFTAVGLGTSAITLSDSPSFPFGDDAGNAVAVTYIGATVAAVPEPGSIGLVLAGVACVGWAARRRQA